MCQAMVAPVLAKIRVARGPFRQIWGEPHLRTLGRFCSTLLLGPLSRCVSPRVDHPSVVDLQLRFPQTDPAEVGAALFKHVHPQEHDVFDFTAWVDRHPGGAFNIEKWSKGTFMVTVPSNHQDSLCGGSAPGVARRRHRKVSVERLLSPMTACLADKFAKAFRSQTLEGQC